MMVVAATVAAARPSGGSSAASFHSGAARLPPQHTHLLIFGSKGYALGQIMRRLQINEHGHERAGAGQEYRRSAMH